MREIERQRHELAREHNAHSFEAAPLGAHEAEIFFCREFISELATVCDGLNTIIGLRAGQPPNVGTPHNRGFHVSTKPIYCKPKTSRGGHEIFPFGGGFIYIDQANFGREKSPHYPSLLKHPKVAKYLGVKHKFTFVPLHIPIDMLDPRSHYYDSDCQVLTHRGEDIYFKYINPHADSRLLNCVFQLTPVDHYPHALPNRGRFYRVSYRPEQARGGLFHALEVLSDPEGRPITGDVDLLQVGAARADTEAQPDWYKPLVSTAQERWSLMHPIQQMHTHFRNSACIETRMQSMCSPDSQYYKDFETLTAESGNTDSWSVYVSHAINVRCRNVGLPKMINHGQDFYSPLHNPADMDTDPILWYVPRTGFYLTCNVRQYAHFLELFSAKYCIAPRQEWLESVRRRPSRDVLANGFVLRDDEIKVMEGGSDRRLFTREGSVRAHSTVPPERGEFRSASVPLTGGTLGSIRLGRSYDLSHRSLDGRMLIPLHRVVPEGTVPLVLGEGYRGIPSTSSSPIFDASFDGSASPTRSTIPALAPPAQLRPLVVRRCPPPYGRCCAESGG